MQTTQDPIIKSSELSWYKRSQVSSASPYENILFEKDRWDFLPELLPFNHHPLWKIASEQCKRLVTSYGWLMYNMRTVCIETRIVSPLCYEIIEGKNQITSNFDFLRIVSQTLTDESYHTLLSIEGIKGIIAHRELPDLEWPELNFSKKYSVSLSNCTKKWEKEIIQMGMVVASEVLISDYLALIATSETIQPLCRRVTNTHWRDELAHANIFRLIAKKVISQFEPLQKEFFIECIINASKWFSDKEFATWEVILSFIGTPGAREIISDSMNNKEKHKNSLADIKIMTLINMLRDAKDVCRVYALPLCELGSQQ